MTVRLRLLGHRSLLVHAQVDPDAFADVYDAYADRVLVFLTRRVLDAEVAFDLLSETFATALERRQQFRGTAPEEEQAWLFAIARTELSHYWRSGKVERAAIQRFAISVPVLSDAELERIEQQAGLNELAPALSDALAALPQEQRRAVELRVVAGAGLRGGGRRAGRDRADRPRARLARPAGARARDARRSEETLVGDTA